VTYRYDASERRVRQDSGGQTTIWVYDAFGQLAAEYATNLTKAEGVYYRTTDHLGSTRIVTNQTAQVVQRRDFFPFGEAIPADSSHGNRQTVLDGGQATYNANIGVKQQFTGQQRDEETGLDYFGARKYLGPLGQFLSVDPGGAGVTPSNPQSWNAFSYSLNSPLTFVDPSGLDPCPSNPDPEAPDCIEVVAPNEIIPVEPVSTYTAGGYESYYGGGGEPPPSNQVGNMINTLMQPSLDQLRAWIENATKDLKENGVRGVYGTVTIPYPEFPFVGGEITVFYSPVTNQFCMSLGLALGLPAAGGHTGFTVVDTEMFKTLDRQTFDNIFFGFAVNLNSYVFGSGGVDVTAAPDLLNAGSGGAMLGSVNGGVDGMAISGGLGGCMAATEENFQQVLDWTRW
jgi:RHS repeat-associated protein